MALIFFWWELSQSMRSDWDGFICLGVQRETGVPKIHTLKGSVQASRPKPPTFTVTGFIAKAEKTSPDNGCSPDVNRNRY